MERRKFSREFKLEAVRLVKDRGVTVAQAARDLDLHENVLRKWMRDLCRPAACVSRPRADEAGAARDRQAAHGVGEAQGGTRHPKKGRSLLREGSDMRFAFIAKHRGIWPVAWLCSALDVSRSGFHAWLNRSPSARSRYDEALLVEIDRASKAATAPTAHAGSGTTFWRKGCPVGCIASNG